MKDGNSNIFKELVGNFMLSINDQSILIVGIFYAKDDSDVDIWGLN